jgi:hypothetical protein
MKIQQALSTYKSLDTNNHVKIIYLPMMRSQKYSDEILKNLVALHLTARTLGANIDNNLDKIPDDVINTGYNQAQIALKSTGSCPDADGTVSTDQSIIESVVDFINFYASFPEKPIFLNMSWTVPDNKFQVLFPEIYGFIVTAAGNDCPDRICANTVYDLQRQFASRSADQRDTIAVMNIGADGLPICGSSLLEALDGALATAFDGSLSTSDCGGTSFASPRITWLLALRESLTDAPGRALDWRIAIRNELAGMRANKENKYNNIRFNVENFFKHVQ